MKKRIFLLLALAAAMVMFAGSASALSFTGGASSMEAHHWRWCNASDPTVCAGCGMGGLTDLPIEHEPGIDYQTDETAHWKTCVRCGQSTDYSEHWSYCDNPNVCRACGVAYSGNNLSHDWDWDNYQYNETEHWLICKTCHAEDTRSRHWSYCDNPDVCAICGATYAGNNIQHELDGWQFDETEHWQVCSRCNSEERKSEHRVYCDNPTVCVVCGASCSGDDIHHDWGNYQHNDTEHWVTCLSCEKELLRENHWEYCDARGVCGFCGAAYSGQNVEHDWKYEYDENEHWAHCSKCSENKDKRGHFRRCDESVCHECGVPYSGNNVTHYYKYGAPFSMDEKDHWHLCSGCGEKVGVEPHTFDANGKCTSCDYQSVSGEVTDTPTDTPTDVPTDVPTDTPTDAPTDAPTDVPTETPTETPTDAPTTEPTEAPTDVPTETPTDTPTDAPTEAPTDTPTDVPTETPTDTPTDIPTDTPTDAPTDVPTAVPTAVPTDVPTAVPTDVPTFVPTDAPTTAPTDVPTAVPTTVPTDAPTAAPAEPVILADAVIEPSEGTALPEGMTLIVADVTAIEPVVVNNTEAVFVFTVAVQGDENAQTLPAAVRITLPLDMDLTGLRLVLIQEDGTETEIAFEVVEGRLVFETALLGVFALVPIQA